MSTYQITYLCLMCLFIVILLVGILIVLITHFKEHKRFQSGVNDIIDDIKYTSRYTYTNADKIWSVIPKIRDDVHAMCERIVIEQAKQIESVDLPMWVAEPCPVCGHKPSIYEYTDGRDTIVLCKHCDNFGYTAGGETVHSAVYMWNKTVTDYVIRANAEKEIKDGGNNE